jgi:gluconolactonase
LISWILNSNSSILQSRKGNGMKVEKLLDLPFYTEGPAVDGFGNCYFTALSGGFVGRIDQEGHYSEWAKGVCLNGQVVTSGGEHWCCDSRSAAISRYDGEGNFLGYVVQNLCANQPVNTPNDLIVDSMQNLYFTDSIRHEGKVFFRAASGEERLVAAGIDYANGLVLSPDEHWLYVAESYQNRILRISLESAGRAKGRPEVFSNLPRNPSGSELGNLPDGLAMDQEGKLWVAHYGMQAIQVLSPAGNLLFSIETGLLLTSNLCFLEDTPERQRLLVTGGYGEPGPGAVLQITID